MKLIIDCGATKADLLRIEDDSTFRTCQVKGINVALCPNTDDLISYFLLMPWLGEASEIYFYGAGCRPGIIGQRTASAIGMSSRARVIETRSDMLGAARAVLGRSSGVACILGTGSNSCRFDGKEITDNIPSLGYVLGDEGSANHMGRLLISGIFKRQFSEDTRRLFHDTFPDLDVEAVIENVYRRPGANSWLGQMAKFLSANINREEVREIVKLSLNDFITKNILPYGEDVHNCQIGFVGSVAYEFRELLEEIMTNYRLSPGTVIRRPIDGLKTYHSS